MFTGNGAFLPVIAGIAMNQSKLRAAIIVFFVGFALGLSVFAASRLLVRSVLASDARSAAEELASRLARSEAIEASGRLASIVRYTYSDPAGNVLKSVTLANGHAHVPAMTAEEVRRAGDAAASGAVVVQSPLLPSILGLSEPAVLGVVVPVVADGKTLGTVFAEVDQASTLEALTRAFSVGGMITVGLAVLAVIVIIFAVTRGRGLIHRRAFNPAMLPRDALTGLPAREGLIATLTDCIARASEADAQFALMVIDLNGFRTVNDIWGHAAGDKVLQLAGERLRGFAPQPGALLRISADDFALIVEGEATSHSLRALADKIREALTEPYLVDGSTIGLGASIGAAIFPVNGETADALFRAADTALTRAKAERNALAFFDTEMEKRLGRRAALERDLRQALERDEFVVFYQAQFELTSRQVSGYEALVRWEHPQEGILAPRDFLQAAEETGLIRPLGNWVLRTACRDAATWLDKGTVSVNFSAAQFRFQDLDVTIAKALDETGLPPERLEIEVPESLFLEHSPDIMATLNRIKAMGVRVTMDDFGAGYSSLSSIAHFPFDKIKIDRSFVAQLTEDADVAAIVASIVGLGRSLSVDIAAEGVETNEQVTLLRAAGCSIVQGFLFGAPQRETPGSGKAAADERGAVTQQDATGPG
jgi:diguanylate cyclase (GGDEF)-like protein